MASQVSHLLWTGWARAEASSTRSRPSAREQEGRGDAGTCRVKASCADPAPGPQGSAEQAVVSGSSGRAASPPATTPMPPPRHRWKALRLFPELRSQPWCGRLLRSCSGASPALRDSAAEPPSLCPWLLRGPGRKQAILGAMWPPPCPLPYFCVQPPPLGHLLLGEPAPDRVGLGEPWGAGEIPANPTAGIFLWSCPIIATK